jgi:hypothetical protein
MRARILAAIATATLASACHSTTAIRPDQLPLLNGSFAVVTGSQRVGNTTVTTGEVSVAHVSAPDGRIVEITGEFNATLVSRVAGVASIDFDHPVQASIEGSMLRVAGGNRAPVDVSLESLERIDVSQYDGVATMLLIVGISLVAGTLISVAIIASVDSGSSYE